MISGLHSHYCPDCKQQKACMQITHCRRGPEAKCADCFYDEMIAEQRIQRREANQENKNDG